MDVVVGNHGSIYLVNPRTPEAERWIYEHTPEDAQWFANALVVDHRYIEDIVRGMDEDGLTILFR